jgi:hypothetical protein
MKPPSDRDMERLSGRVDQNVANLIESKQVVDHGINIRNNVNQRDLESNAV